VIPRGVGRTIAHERLSKEVETTRDRVRLVCDWESSSQAGHQTPCPGERSPIAFRILVVGARWDRIKEVMCTQELRCCTYARSFEEQQHHPHNYILHLTRGIRESIYDYP
jgi:hypothetical protein